MSEQPDLTTEQIEQIIAQVQFAENGLVPAIAQQWDTGEVLMMAWMSAESIRRTLTERLAVYWSRSRDELWRKGDTSGHTQVVKSFAVDCDADTVLLRVHQEGAACHLGTRTCWDSDPNAVHFS
ncbi:phosphoribosyl-AMP cyclohydrolase [Gulosibacter massiliensis]|uniref:phosphoribosyl-AMP cyclohydrolase n=1 Tax=Gulosibacter massiliensis TaxID=2479839 RepID=UPI000F643FE6|nr:phosphoribosyl-AMP cyclohydrolase [Gulosibacter massiliensis]